MMDFLGFYIRHSARDWKRARNAALLTLRFPRADDIPVWENCAPRVESAPQRQHDLLIASRGASNSADRLADGLVPARRHACSTCL